MPVRPIIAVLFILAAAERVAAQSGPDRDPLAEAAAIVESTGSDPLAEAAAIVESAGPLPSSGNRAELLATHELLMKPTAWYYHFCRPGEFGTYTFRLHVLYPDGTWIFSNDSFHGDGTIDRKYANVEYFINETIDNGSPGGAGTWTLGKDGEIETKIKYLTEYRKSEYEPDLDEKKFRESVVLYGLNLYAYYTPKRLRIKPGADSKYDYIRLDPVPRIFGSTSRDFGLHKLVPIDD